jgi:hypothetical protein
MPPTDMLGIRTVFGAFPSRIERELCGRHAQLGMPSPVRTDAVCRRRSLALVLPRRSSRESPGEQHHGDLMTKAW